MAAIPLTHLGLSLFAGSLTTLSPCVFPILPLVIGGAVQANRLAPLAMGTGGTSFSLIGIVLGALGPALGIDSDSVRIFGAWLLDRLRPGHAGAATEPALHGMDAADRLGRQRGVDEAGRRLARRRPRCSAALSASSGAPARGRCSPRR